MISQSLMREVSRRRRDDATSGLVVDLAIHPPRPCVAVYLLAPGSRRFHLEHSGIGGVPEFVANWIDLAGRMNVALCFSDVAAAVLEDLATGDGEWTSYLAWLSVTLKKQREARERAVAKRQRERSKVCVVRK